MNTSEVTFRELVLDVTTLAFVRDSHGVFVVVDPVVQTRPFFQEHDEDEDPRTTAVILMVDRAQTWVDRRRLPHDQAVRVDCRLRHQLHREVAVRTAASTAPATYQPEASSCKVFTVQTDWVFRLQRPQAPRPKQHQTKLADRHVTYDPLM